MQYQHPKIFLFIVGTKWPSSSKNPIRTASKDPVVVFPNDVRIISYEIFAQIIGFHDKSREIFDKIIDYNYNWDVEALDNLKIHLKTYNTTELKKNYDFKKIFNQSEKKREKSV